MFFTVKTQKDVFLTLVPSYSITRCHDFHELKRKNSQTEAKMTNWFLVGLLGKVAVPGSLLLFSLLWVHYESAEGILDQKPTSTTVTANRSTFFNCSMSNNKSDELTWHHYPLEGKAKAVYEAGSIRGTYIGRFDIEKNLTSGTFNLLVQRPEPTDAGKYECVEDPLKKDTGAFAELTVLGSNLVCESDKDLNEVVGPTECAKPIAPDQLQLSCSVTYSGNFPPKMEWRNVGSELQSNETNCGDLGNRVMCNATVKANLNMDGSVYICQIITAEQYNCSLKVNKTIYTFPDTSVKTVTTTEEEFCFANTSKDLPCSYKWFKDNKTEQEQLGQILKPSSPGLYICQAECKIRNETCAFTAMVINASEPASSITESGNLTLLWLLVLLIIAIVIVAGLVYHFRKKCWRPQLINRFTPKPLQGPPPGPPSGPLSEEIPLIPGQNEGSETDEDNAIQKACSDDRYLYKGLNGIIYRPEQYKGKQCTWEKILVGEYQKTRKNEEVMTEVEKICENGRQWMTLKHKNLIKIHNVILRPQAVYIVMEYAAGRTVEKALQRYKKGLPMPEVKNWAIQIAQGIEYLHGNGSNGIIHKNIKSAQIFILEEMKEPSDISKKTLKLGCINFLDNDAINDGSSLKQNESYLSPEVVEGGKHSAKSDVWSFSVVVWELLTGEPSENATWSHKITKDLENSNVCPEELKGILSDCRIEEPSKRPTFIEIVDRLQEWQL